MARRPLTLVLGGVGVKGLASIGVLGALRRHRVPIRRIVATGASGAVAAYFALGRNMTQLEHRLTRFFIEHHRFLWGMAWTAGLFQTRRHVLTESLPYFLQERLYCFANVKKVSVLEWNVLEPAITSLFGDTTTEDLKLPVSFVAMDLRSQEVVTLTEGRLRDLVRVSIAFPGLFPPVSYGGDLLVSGAAACELPLDAVTKADAPALAVDFPSHFCLQRPASMVEVMAQCMEIRAEAIKENLLRRARYVFQLEGMRFFQWGSYRRIPQMIEKAREETERQLQNSPIIRKRRGFLGLGS